MNTMVVITDQERDIYTMDAASKSLEGTGAENVSYEKWLKEYDNDGKITRVGILSFDPFLPLYRSIETLTFLLFFLSRSRHAIAVSSFSSTGDS